MKRAIVVAAFLLASSIAGAKEYTHQKYFEHYEGTKTCLACHMKEAESFFSSQHYQWKGEAPQIVDAAGRKLGKANTINDFCTNPIASWAGLVRNSRGEIISKGCSACHAGLGKLPSEAKSQEQIENIDCLICHASGYQRDLYPAAEGEGWAWKPILWKNQEGLDSVSKRIGQPTRTTCLRCHASSGGGPNFKRGDLEYALTDCDREFDVHMGSNGAGMQCIDCHAGEDHRVRGRGTDLAASDMPGNPLSCADADCHGDAPHAARVLNHHTTRVACATCHIPTFARADATDMHRDWSKPVYKEEADKYAPTIQLQKDVQPVYAWYNGRTEAQLPGEAVKKIADGSVVMMMPVGSREDPASRIYPFKLHRGRMPVLEGRNWLIPIVVEEFFADGDIDKAVKNAADKMYQVKDGRYSWTDTTRYMGIFHEVVPAKKALGCLDCHADAGRLDWKKLGYEGGDPLAALIK